MNAPWHRRLPCWVMPVWILLTAACDSGAPPSPPLQEVRPVIILAIDQLGEPELAHPDVYRPGFVFELHPESESPARVAGFFLTVATGAADALQLCLRDRHLGRTTSVRRLAAPQNRSTLMADATWSLEPTVSAQLDAGNPVCWLLDQDTSDNPLEQRVAVAIPESLITAATSLEVFSSRAPDGSALGADRFDLVREFFYMAAAGDSGVWGNGLRDEDKFTTLVARQIEVESRRKVILRNHAISGSSIVPSDEDGTCQGLCGGEVPRALTSITDQVLSIERPELIDVLILDGCGNDVGLPTILSGDADLEELVDLTQQFCRHEMIRLLQLARQRLPQAHIVVTGYYPFISEQSDLADVEQLLILRDFPFLAEGDLQELLQSVAQGAVAFLEASREHLLTAVAAVNAASAEGAVVAFADPAFGPENATFAPQPWLWGLQSNGEVVEALELGMEFRAFPEDPLLEYRAAACLESGVVPELIPCIYGSVLHPNPAGARAYADAVLAALRELDAVPVLQP